LYYNSTASKWENKLIGESDITNLTTDLGNKADLVSGVLKSSEVPTNIITSLNSKTTTNNSIILNLADLGTVSISSPSTNQVLEYNGTTWVNATLSTTSTLAGATDVSLGTLANNQFLYYNSGASKWENKLIGESDITNLTTDLGNKVSSVNSINPTSGNVSIGIANMNDASITTPSNNQVLQYNSSTGKWDNATLSTGSSTLASLTDVSLSSLTGGGSSDTYMTTSNGIYKSPDLVNWTLMCSLPESTTNSKVVFYYLNGKYIYIPYSNNVYTSTNGTTYTNVSANLSSVWNSTSGNLYGSCDDGTNLIIWTNIGVVYAPSPFTNWTVALGTDYNNVNFAYNPSTSTYVSGAVSNSTNTVYWQKSTNLTSWTNFFTVQTIYHLLLK
jgi:hypothetical protein